MNVATMPATLAGVSDEEWRIRCDLAALYRLVAHHRWTDFVYTHISARLPGPDHHFLKIGNESLKEQTNPEEGASRKLTVSKLRG